MAQSHGSPRGSQSVRDLLLSLLPLVLIILAVAGLAGMCSLRPGGPTVASRSAPSVDAQVGLNRLARRLPFPVRVPTLPPDWQATSVETESVQTAAGTPAAVQVGWLTPVGNYLRLSQSPVTERDLVAFETGRLAAALGAVRVAGQTWVRYPSRRDEQAWVADLGRVRVLITGSGTPAEFRRLATATLEGAVLR